MRRAVEITRQAHTAAMRAARDGVKEYEIEALIDYTFRRNGGHPGYGTIVGGGVNATILHYVDNDQPLRGGELLLVDAGCEIDGFTADVTRTYPIGARFSPAQKRCYELVLAVEKACVAAVRPGHSIDAIHEQAVELLTRGMIDLGLLSGDVGALIEKAAYKRFYMHRTSHWLGMDVHDVGIYAPDGKSRPLRAGHGAHRRARALHRRGRRRRRRRVSRHRHPHRGRRARDRRRPREPHHLDPEGSLRSRGANRTSSATSPISWIAAATSCGVDSSSSTSSSK